MNILNIEPIFITSAGEVTAKVYFIVRVDDKDTKPLIAARISQSDSNLYFQDHAALASTGLSSSAISQYGNTWPVSLTPSLGENGELSTSLSRQFEQIDFGTGKTGLVELNNYDFSTGGFKTVKRKIFANSGNYEDVPFAKKGWVRGLGFGLLASGLVALLLFVFRPSK